MVVPPTSRRHSKPTYQAEALARAPTTASNALVNGPGSETTVPGRFRVQRYSNVNVSVHVFVYLMLNTVTGSTLVTSENRKGVFFWVVKLNLEKAKKNTFGDSVIEAK